MRSAKLYFKNGFTVWTWHQLRGGRMMVEKNFYGNDGYYRADASFSVEMSQDNLLRSLNMAKECLKKVEIY